LSKPFSVTCEESKRHISSIRKMPSATMNAFDVLVDDIRKVLGPSSRLTSDDVDVQDLTCLMERYVSKSDEWEPYYLLNPRMGYTRNLVDEGNGKANLVSPSRQQILLLCSHANAILPIARLGMDTWQG